MASTATATAKPLASQLIPRSRKSNIPGAPSLSSIDRSLRRGWTSSASAATTEHHAGPGMFCTRACAATTPMSILPPSGTAGWPTCNGRATAVARAARHIRVTSNRLGPDFHARRLPLPPMPIPRRQCVCDLMQNRIPHFLFPIEQRQWPGKRDSLSRVRATSKPPPRMIKMKRPSRQPMTGHQRTGKINRSVVDFHRSSDNMEKIPRKNCSGHIQWSDRLGNFLERRNA